MAELIQESGARNESTKLDAERIAQDSFRRDANQPGSERAGETAAHLLAMLPRHPDFDIAQELRDGKINNIVRNKIENIVKQQYKDGGRASVTNLVSDVNEWLAVHNSNFRVEFGLPSSKGEGALALTVRDNRNLDKQKLSDFDMDDKPANSVPAGIADTLKHGTFSDADRILVENEFKKAFQTGGVTAREQLLKDINSELEARGSDFRLKSGDTIIKCLNAQELHLENKNSGAINKLTDIDLDDKPRPVEAGAIADRIKNGGFVRLDQVEIENAFKEAFLNKGVKGANELLKQINEELKQLQSDFTLERRPSADNKQFNLGLKELKSDDARPISSFSLDEPYRHVDLSNLINFMPANEITVIDMSTTKPPRNQGNDDILQSVEAILDRSAVDAANHTDSNRDTTKPTRNQGNEAILKSIESILGQ